jgi:hypothetical protein
MHVECTWTTPQFYFFYCLFTIAMLTLGLACFLPDYHLFHHMLYCVSHTLGISASLTRRYETCIYTEQSVQYIQSVL